MTIADTSTAQIGFIEETTWGTTPSTPALQLLRFTGESLNANIATIVSNEIRSDRNIPDLVQTSAEAAGDINCELSYGTYDALFEGGMLSVWGSSTTYTSTGASDITVTASTGAIVSGGTAFTNVVVGQWIRLHNFVAIDGFYRVQTRTDASNITVRPLPVSDHASLGTTETITSGGKIRNGTTRKFYTFQKKFTATAAEYFNFSGSYISKFDFNFERQAMVTGSFGLMSKYGSRTDSQFSGASFPAATTTDVMNGVANVSGLYEGGFLLANASAAKIANMTISLNNNLRGQNAIGDIQHVGIGLGRGAITGALNTYFEDGSLYTKFVANTSTSVSFRVADTAGNTYIFTLPKIKLSKGTIVAGGIDQDIMANFDYQAIYDSTTGCTIQIDRFAAF